MLSVLDGTVAIPRRATIYYHCLRAGVDEQTVTEVLVNGNPRPSPYLLSPVRDFLTTETSSEPDFRLLFTFGMSPVHTQKKIKADLLNYGALYLDILHKRC